MACLMPRICQLADRTEGEPRPPTGGWKERMKMAKKTSELLSALGKLFEIFKAFVDEVKNQGGTDEDISRILTDKKVCQEMVGLLLKKAGNVADAAIRLFVDYTRSLAEMLKDGRFDSVNPDITEKHFPITKRPNGKVEMKMFHFNRPISSEQAIQEMDKEGYRPAELPEGLAYVQANPDEQRKYPIVLLGSVWHYWYGDRHVPYLGRWAGERYLGLGWFEFDWNECYRFLAVRK